MPLHDSKIIYYLNDRNEGRYYFCRILALPNAPPPSLDATILNYFSDSERGGAIILCRILATAPPPPPDATILNYLNDRERRALLFFVGFWHPPMIPPSPQTSQYFTILMTERERAPLSFCRILAPPPPNAPPDSKILYYLNDRDEGRYYFCRILAPPPPPQCPPSRSSRHNT